MVLDPNTGNVPEIILCIKHNFEQRFIEAVFYQNNSKNVKYWHINNIIDL